MRTASAYAIRRATGPRRCGLGPICPVAARRCLSRRTHAVLTMYLAATAEVFISASTSASTRSRKSSI